MRLQSLELQQISIQDAFWSQHVDLVRNAIIPYQWEAMNDRIPDAESSHCLENFKIAAGKGRILRGGFSGYGCCQVAGGSGIYAELLSGSGIGEDGR